MIISQYPYLTKEMLANPFSAPSSKVRNIVKSSAYLTTINARSALEMGLSGLQFNEGDEVLLPAYHCPVMVYPLIKLGLIPVFYKIAADCSADLSDVLSLMSSRTKGIIAIHYFGFPQNISGLQDICRKHKLTLIEDCAHSFFGEINHSVVGSFGDISIASLWKFFPICHGGFLIINNQEMVREIYSKQASITFQLKSAINTVEMGFATGNQKGLLSNILKIKDKIWAVVKILKKTKDNLDKVKSNASAVQKRIKNPYAFEQVKGTYTNEKMPLISKIIYKLSNQEKMVERRVSNYRILESELKKIKGIEPLFGMLPDKVVPYNFPVLVKDPNRFVEKLRGENVNISRFGHIRWDGMVWDKNSVASIYSKNCIQLPTHQSLSSADVYRMVDIIKAVCH